MSAERLRELRARDARARLAAQREFERPLVLEAGAGTGKTATLVARVVGWALGPGWARAVARTDDADVEATAAAVLARVVAITFTEAAAAEMAERVGEAFRDLEHGRCPPGVDPAQLLVPERARRSRALRSALDHLGVHTIHAFCRRLLAARPLEAGLHPDFEVDPEGERQEQVVREVLEGRLRDAYAEPGDPATLALAELGIGPPELEEALLALVREGVASRVLARDPFEPTLVEAAVAALADDVARLRRLESGRLAALGRGARVTTETASGLGDTEAALRAAASVVREAQAVREVLAALAARLDALWDGPTGGRLRSWGRGRFNGSEVRALGGDQLAFSDAAALVSTGVAGLRALRPGLLDAARRVLLPLLGEIERELRARGVLSFTDLLHRTRELLARHPRVAASARRGIDQLLVDEFQDTDALQCDVIERLSLRGPAQERPGLFLVGDPKQSIYGWRNAELRAYERFVERVIEEGGALERLTVTFRAAPPLLDEIEAVIAPVMRSEPGRQPEFQPLAPSEEREAHTGFARGRFAPVEHWVSWTASDGAPPATGAPAAEVAALEAAALARDLRELHETHGVPWREFGVLFRSRGDLDVYLDALREAGVPYAVEGDRRYYQRREIIDAAALVRCVLDPNDHLSLLTLLRSPVVGVPDAALIPLWGAGFPRLATELSGDEPGRLAELRERVRETALALPPGVPGLERVLGWERNLERALAALAALRRSFRTDPGDVFVENLRALLLVEATEAARHQGAYRLANLERFFGQLVAALGSGEGGTHALLRRLRRRVAEEFEEDEARPELDAEAVRILTIHQAKGLGFGHVYVMQLHRKPGAPPSRALPLATATDDGFEYRLFGAQTLGLEAALAEREAVSRAENVRTLYVAMTRARDRLVLVGDRPARQRGEPPLAAARSHADLLRGRRGGTPELEALAAAGRSDACGARWVFPARDEETLRLDTARATPLASPERVQEQSAVLRERGAAARARMSRPLSAPASADAHRALAELIESAPGPARTGVDGRLALAVGSAVHRVLERLDLERLDLASGPEGQRAEAERALREALAGLLPDERLDEGLEAGGELLRRLFSGPLLERLRRLAGHVVARELPLLVPPAPERGPLGHVGGAIDLVYRDPADGAFVVADFKTDRVEGEQEIAARCAAYASQGATYTRAVREALELEREPRFELWFLHAGRVEATA